MSKSRFSIGAVVFWAALLAPPPARAAFSYVNLPGITGENPVLGHPASIAVQSLTIAPDAFSVVKRVDAASPGISLAVAQGTQLGTASVLLYNGTPGATADETLTFPHALASSYQLLSGAGLPLEQDGFRSTAPAFLYLEMDGLSGSASLPGHPGVIPDQSFSLTDHSFSVVRRVDATSPRLALAAALGTPFTGARLLVYDSSPAGPPDAVLPFDNLVVSSYQLLGGVGAPTERDGFQFEGIPAAPASATPEPSSLVLLGIGAFGLSARRAAGSGAATASRLSRRRNSDSSRHTPR